MAFLEKITKYNYHKLFKPPFYPVYDGWFNFITDRLNSISDNDGAIKMTSINNTTAGTTATVNAPTGSVTVSHASLAGLASSTFTLTNSYITATSIVILQLGAYTGTGIPIVQKIAPSAGSATITIYNAHASIALNANLKIMFAIVG